MRESMTRINGYSRAAVQSCLDVVSWLAPENGATVALDVGVERMPGPAAQRFRLPRLHDQGRSGRRFPAGGAHRLAQRAAGLPAGADRSRGLPGGCGDHGAAGLGTGRAHGGSEARSGLTRVRRRCGVSPAGVARSRGFGAGRGHCARPYAANRFASPSRPPEKKRPAAGSAAGRIPKGDLLCCPGAAATGVAAAHSSYRL